MVTPQSISPNRPEHQIRWLLISIPLCAVGIGLFGVAYNGFWLWKMRRDNREDIGDWLAMTLDIEKRKARNGDWLMAPGKAWLTRSQFRERVGRQSQ